MMKTQNTRPVYPVLFITYIVSLLGLIASIVWLNLLTFNHKSDSTETITTPKREQVQKLRISKENSTVKIFTIPFTIPKQAGLTPKENITAVQLTAESLLITS